MSEPKLAPTVSVVMPAYNAARFVVEAVESILSQTFGDFEFLIVDDGSTDETPEILRSFAARDARIRLTIRPNIGLVRTLNEMLESARGEFVARMDSDDVSLPERFRRQMEFLREHPKVVAAGSKVILIDPEGDVLCEVCDKQSHEMIDQAHLAGIGGMICHPAAMIRTEALRVVDGYRTEFELSEDLDLWLRLAEVGELVNLPDVLVKYRQHAQSRGYTHQERQHRFVAKAVQDARVRRGLPATENRAARSGACDTIRDEADHRYHWAWWALRAGNLRSARKNALRRLRLRPLSLESWRVAACTVRGY